MDGDWSRSWAQARRAVAQGRVMLAVALVHFVILLALLALRGPSFDLRRAAPPLSLFTVPEPPLRVLPPPPARHVGGGAARKAGLDLIHAVTRPVPLATTMGDNGPAPADIDGAAKGRVGVGDGLGSAGSGAIPLPKQPAPVEVELPPIRFPVVTDAAWKRQISDDELRALLGPKLARHPIQVSLRLSCEVLASTRVRDCRVLDETPPGTGVASVVLRAAPYFRIDPPRHDGVAADRTRVTIMWDVDIKPARHVPFDLPPNVQ